MFILNGKINWLVLQLPMLQLGSIQPAKQLHVPSVGLQVLQFEEKTREQLYP